MDKLDKHTIPLVSVVMTTYNGLPYLQEQLDSVLHQSFDQLELIVADDDSVDATRIVLKEYAERDLRIRILPSIGNLGLHKNLERALREAVAPLIAISDQDDIWEQTKLERLIEGIGDADAVYSDSLLIDADGRSKGVTIMDRIKVRQPIKGSLAGIALLRKNCVSGHAMLFRRELLDLALPFDDGMLFDQQLAYLATTGRGLKYVDELLVRHRIHGENQSNSGLIDLLDTANKVWGDPCIDRRAQFKRDFIYRVESMLSRFPARDRHRGNLMGWVLKKMLERMRRHDASFFDIRLFFLLLLIRRYFFYPKEKAIIGQCFKYAKGGRYYLWQNRKKEKSND